MIARDPTLLQMVAHGLGRHAHPGNSGRTSQRHCAIWRSCPLQEPMPQRHLPRLAAQEDAARRMRRSGKIIRAMAEVVCN
ncbi:MULTISPECIES: hypothetical protein [unclassified Mesorhizobium]|uniref:hypothetical protein n=1 Tax=unclassified Mesorhizobium TaxID=325217 RepID=UPI00041FAA5F|nr:MULTISPECIES: hypothetical protein [unclassified Mesorhizobium]RWN63067.1 MAG: hypothetical protein EOS00_04210 [Mesorhizobium sp.]